MSMSDDHNFWWVTLPKKKLRCRYRGIREYDDFPSPKKEDRVRNVKQGMESLKHAICFLELAHQDVGDEVRNSLIDAHQRLNEWVLPSLGAEPIRSSRYQRLMDRKKT